MLKFFKKILIFIIRNLIELIEKYEYRNISLDEDNISKKIIKSINLMNMKVKTDTGYQFATDIHITQPYKHYKVKTKDFELLCADNHILFDKNFKEVFTKNL